MQHHVMPPETCQEKLWRSRPRRRIVLKTDKKRKHRSLRITPSTFYKRDPPDPQRHRYLQQGQVQLRERPTRPADSRTTTGVPPSPVGRSRPQSAFYSPAICQAQRQREHQGRRDQVHWLQVKVHIVQLNTFLVMRLPIF